ncbi:hypothetical protein IDH41_10450 [Paenibacillus sp. IB182493]|uniref:YtkA-like domain-containing protein n=2 Tax=Paenibacillus arenilitoris TaxID=2772299 RepID=A0A927H6X0_9BACL|nr:hypothetical protein [Paenibacillus arenilitoris]
MAIMAVITVFGVLTACSAEPPIDPELVEMTLSTEPETVTAGTPAKLQATFSGVELSDDAQVTFDFRVGDEPKLVDAVRSGEGFDADFTFPDKGIQTVYVHLYEGDLHLTKKKWVEVK